MRKTNSICLIGVLLLSLFASLASGHAQQPERNVPADQDGERLKVLLERAGERAKKFQEDLYSVKWTEVRRSQELKVDLTPKGKPRESVVETIVVHRTAPGDQQKTYAAAVTELKSADGKTPKEKKVRIPPEGDQKFAYHHPLEFLLPERQAEWAFGWEGETEFHGLKAVMVTAIPSVVTKPAAKVRGRRFFVEGLQQKARVWIDPQTCDVLQVEWQLLDKFSFKSGFGLNWYGPFFVTRPDRQIEYEKWETTIRFARVEFHNPEQTLLLPVSEELLRVIRGARNPAYRLTRAFTDYKRFVTDVKVKVQDHHPIEETR